MGSKVVNTTSANLRNYSIKQLAAIRDLIEDTAVDIEIQAQRAAPKHFINIDKRIYDKGFTAEVGVIGDNPIAAYFEFGTGLSARSILAPYPDWVKTIAMTFYKSGDGTLKGQPYLYPAVFTSTAAYNRKLNDLTKKNTVDNG